MHFFLDIFKKFYLIFTWGIKKRRLFSVTERGFFVFWGIDNTARI